MNDIYENDNSGFSTASVGSESLTDNIDRTEQAPAPAEAAQGIIAEQPDPVQDPRYTVPVQQVRGSGYYYGMTGYAGEGYGQGQDAGNYSYSGATQGRAYGDPYIGSNNYGAYNFNTQAGGSQGYARSVSDVQLAASSGNGKDNEAKPPKKKGKGRHILAIGIVLVLVFLSAGGGYLAARSIYSDSDSTSFSRDDMSDDRSAEETRADGKKDAAADKEKTGGSQNEWKLGTKEPVAPTGRGITMDVSGVAEIALPSIVAITTTSVQEIQNVFSMWGYYGGGNTYEVQSAGSGIIVGQSETDLLIATNYHVIENAESLSVSFCDDNVYDATVKGGDSGVDIALVHVSLDDLSDETKASIAAVSIGSSADLKIGEQVVAIGNALGKGQSVTTGIVSALERTNSTSTATLLQTDAAINPGNSGGALLNMNGELIGVNNSKYSETDVEGTGYAIPIDTVAPILERIENKVQRSAVSDDQASYIGIRGQDVDSYVQALYGMPKGVYITEVIDGGPFAKAGIPAGGVLTYFDDESVTSMDGLKELLSYYASGETVNVTVQVLENNVYTAHDYEIVLGSAKDAPPTNNQSQYPYGYGNSGGYGNNNIN